MSADKAPAPANPKAKRRFVHFRVRAFLPNHQRHEMIVSIDREAGVLSFRAPRSRREYSIPLATVLELAARRVDKAEVEARLGTAPARMPGPRMV